MLPDVTAVDKAFDYLIPDELARLVRAGSIVRVMLAGRKVRGWVLDADVASNVDAAKLRPILAVVSAGPPADVIALCEWIAWTYCGPLAAVLRSASPPNNVAASVFEHQGTETINAFDRGASDGVGALVHTALAAPATDLDRAADTIARNVLGDEGRTADRLAVVRWPPRADRRRLVARLLAARGSTIVVTADGTRAEAFARWLRTMTPRVALLHSDVVASARTDAWRVAAGGDCVVVGGRMAVLAPVPDLACVVVLDDADEALQEERTPTWHARDALVHRARSNGAAAFVVSPAPTVYATVTVTATATVAMNKIPAVVAPSSAIERDGWPRVDVVDLREQPPGRRLLSEPLVDAIRACLDRFAPAVLVLNRRGGVRLLRCANCHELTRWDASGRPLWDHGAPDDIEVKPTFCTNCAGTKLSVLSGGVQRLAPELAAVLNGVEVAVVDAAVTEAPDVGVLVGTEAVLHRREVRRRRPGLVAFVDFDAELYAARYRASEQALWLIVRASHVMSGRERSDCRVLIQTHEPDHVVVRAAVGGDPTLVAADELERRRSFTLPPFCALAEIRGDAAALDLAQTACTQSLNDNPTVEIRVDRDDQRMLVQAPDAATLAEVVQAAVAVGRTVGKLRVMVDPPRI